MLSYKDFKKATEQITKDSSVMKGSSGRDGSPVAKVWLTCLDVLDKKDIHDDFVGFVKLVEKADNHELSHWLFSKKEFIDRFPKIDRPMLTLASKYLIAVPGGKKDMTENVSYFFREYMYAFNSIHSQKISDEERNFVLDKFGINFIKMAPKSSNVYKNLDSDNNALNGHYVGYKDEDNLDRMDLAKKLGYLSVIPGELLKSAFDKTVSLLDTSDRHDLFQNVCKKSAQLNSDAAHIVLDVGIKQKFITKEEVKYFYTEQFVSTLKKDSKFFYSALYKPKHIEFAEQGICVSLDLIKKMLDKEYTKFTESSTFVLHLPWLTESREFDASFFMNPVEMKRIENCPNLTPTEVRDLRGMLPLLKEQQDAQRLKDAIELALPEMQDKKQEDFPRNLKL